MPAFCEGRSALLDTFGHVGIFFIGQSVDPRYTRLHSPPPEKFGGRPRQDSRVFPRETNGANSAVDGLL